MLTRGQARLGRPAIVVGVVGALVAATPAIASPTSDPTEGRAVFTGAASASVTSIDVNPAALGLTKQNELYIAVTAALEDYHIDQRTLDIASGDLGTGPGVHDLELSPGTTVAGLFHFLKDAAVIAAEFRTPPGQAFPSGQTALGYSTLGGGERDYYAKLAITGKITDDLYVGGSLAAETNVLNLSFLRDTALAAGHGAGGIDSDCGGGVACGVGNPAAAQRYDIHVTTPLFAVSGLAVTFGGVYQIARDVWLGAAFHFPPGTAVQSDLSGEATVTQAPRDGGAIVKGQSTVYFSQPASVDAELRARLFADYDLHVGGRWEDLSRQSSYEVHTSGAELATAGVPEWIERARGLRDPFALWAGVEQADSGEYQTWRFGARVGFESASVDADRTSPLTIAGDSYTLDLGAQWRISSRINVQLDYGFAFFPTVSVTHSAFDPRSQINCIASGYDYTTPGCSDVRNGYAEPTADGDYHRMEHAVRLGFRYDFPP